MRVVFFGTPQFAVPTLEALIQHPDFDVALVVTQPDKRRGRGNQLSPSPVKAIAQTHNLPVIQPPNIKKSEADLALLREANADCFVVVAYGQILSQVILDMPRYGCINGHGSLLPQYRGAAPIQWCLHQGETVTGMTTMLMDIGMRDTNGLELTGRLQGRSREEEPLHLREHLLDRRAFRHLAAFCGALRPTTTVRMRGAKTLRAASRLRNAARAGRHRQGRCDIRFVDSLPPEFHCRRSFTAAGVSLPSEFHCRRSFTAVGASLPPV
ncbi:MAG: hypothetical protein RLZZ511_1389, partial [Cyanobacteriota bacterium]